MLDGMLSSFRSHKLLSESFYEVLLRHCPVMVFVKDEYFNIVYANEAFLDLYAPDQRAGVVGLPSADHFVAIDAKVFNAEDMKALENGMSEIVEEVTDWRGDHRILHTRKIRFVDQDGQTRILGIANDITRLAARERMLAKSNLALENFAALAAHDLRSPLGAIRSSLELIDNDESSNLSAKAQRHMGLMSTCLDGLMEQVANLLTSYKTDEKREDIREECDLSVLFEEVRFSLSNKIDATRGRVLSSELPRMKVNRSMIRQLFHNLIENSLKYRAKDTPIVILRHDMERNEHHFAVEDNGIGVAAENRDNIFGLYSQVDQSADGAGIGLALCRKIVEMHGGRIWLDEGYKGGCRICFNIPA